MITTKVLSSDKILQSSNNIVNKQDNDNRIYSQGIPRRLDYPIISFCLDAIIFSLVFLFSFHFYFINRVWDISVVGWLGFSMIVAAILLYKSEVYHYTKHHNFFVEAKRVTRGVIASSFMIFGLCYIFKVNLLSPELLIVSYGVGLAGLIVWRTLWQAYHYVNYATNIDLPKKPLIISSSESSQDLIDILNKISDAKVNLQGIVTNQSHVKNIEVLGDLSSDMEAILRSEEVDSVIIALSRDYDALQADLLTLLTDLSIVGYILPAYMDVSIHPKDIKTIDDLPFVVINNDRLHPISLVLKRILDIVLASIAIIMTLPVQIFVIFAIKSESDGPVMYVQERVGLNGEKFKIFKYRSMYVDADKRLDEVSQKDKHGRTIQHKRPGDPRITKIGKFIRKTSLDELPQLINVIRGDMSLVGPRPELPYLVNEYEPWQRHRFMAPQGITGWWQVNGRSLNSCHMSTHEDIYYINNFSFMMDLQIILMTIPVLLRREGAF